MNAPAVYRGVMVSGTFEDLGGHRAALIDALLKQDVMPVSMEKKTPSAVHDLVSGSLAMVAESSAYICLIGHCYGQVPQLANNPDGWSLTRLEFEEAQRLERPTLVFVMGDDHDVKPGHVELDPVKREGLTAFRQRAQAGRIYHTFNNIEEFKEQAIHAVAKLARLLEEPTSQRSMVPAMAPDTASVRVQLRLPASGGHLFGREGELAALDAALDDPGVRLASLVAMGGTGKTALVNRWLTGLRDRNYGTVRRVYGWSFYSQGAGVDRQATSEAFLDAALGWFGDGEAAVGDPWSRGARLAELVAREPTVLVLDGLEPLQTPPGDGGGALRDPGLQALLAGLAMNGQGLCLLTTRLPVSDLDHQEGSALQRNRLGRLDETAGLALLAALGVHGSEQNLRDAVAAFEGHALALNLLGKYLALAHSGQASHYREVGPLSFAAAEGGHARRVMTAYGHWLGDGAELDLLLLLGLFDRPAEPTALAALLTDDALNDLTHRLRDETTRAMAAGRLRELGLLAPADLVAGQLDAHPLVREHHGHLLAAEQPELARAAHGRLYEYFRDQPEDHQPKTLAELEPLLRAVHHGCRANRRGEALVQVYYPRIYQEDGFIVKKLGAYGSNLSALAGFFEQTWSQPAPELEPVWQAALLNWAAFALRALGRSREAAEPMEASFKLMVALEDWKQAAGNASNLSQLWLALGEVARAITWGERAVNHADQSEDLSRRMVTRTTLAEARHAAGQTEAAATLFAEAETLQRQWHPHEPYLYSLQGYRYHDLLLARGQHEAVTQRAKYALEISTQNGWLLANGLDKLALARAGEAALAAGQGSVEEVSNAYEQALTALRKAGSQDEIPRGLIAQAAHQRSSGQTEAAQRNLDEARAIAQRGGMNLYLVDIHLEQARLAQSLSEEQTATHHYQKAASLIQKTGYLRRLPEIVTSGK